MKTLKLIILGMVLCFAGSVQAQVSVNVNIGAPPQWGPSGYSDVRYYYLPDVESYYDVQSSRFIYYERGVWVHRTYLPARYRNYDLYGGYKVVMNDYRGDRPYGNFKEYKVKYKKGYRGHEQHNIGVRPGKGNNDARYSREVNRGNQGNDHGNYKREGNDNRNGNGNSGRGNEKGGGKDKGNDHGNGGGHGKKK